MLSHNDIHYLVTLIVLTTQDNRVDFRLGDRIKDSTAGKRRDVDITIRYTNPDGSLGALAGIEVKNHRRPLSLEVEQLCTKLNDMPDLTHKAIISSSGYTRTAIKKAKQHGIELIHFENWKFAHLENSLGVKFTDDFSVNVNYFEFEGPWDYVFHGTSARLNEKNISILNDGYMAFINCFEDIISHGKREFLERFQKQKKLDLHESQDVVFDVNFREKIPFEHISGITFYVERISIRGRITRKPLFVEPKYFSLRVDGSKSPYVACVIFDSKERIEIGGIVVFGGIAKLIKIPFSARLKSKIQNIEARFLSENLATLIDFSGDKITELPLRQSSEFSVVPRHDNNLISNLKTNSTFRTVQLDICSIK